jgi:hypothetical protein
VKPKSSRRRLRAGTPFLAGALWLAAGCSRSGLDVGDYQWIDGKPVLDEAGVPIEDAQPPAEDATSPKKCIPKDEVCNGLDDDCNGAVDDLAAIPCPNGGNQYCIAGNWSSCPKACDVCLPGSERVCFNSFCKYWAVQTCTSDGKSFGVCKETDVPPECSDVANKHKYSSELEQCCLDNDYCCADDFDLDHDGNSTEMIGNCEEVQCSP